MAIAPARAAALAILRAVAEPQGDLGDALARAREGLADERDRALASEIALGTLRHRTALDYQLGVRLSRPLTRMDAVVVDILRIGAFQLLHLARVPASAIVHDAVSETRRAGKSSAAGMVNAVLRRLARERDALSWPPAPAPAETAAERALLVEHLSVVFSHPAWLVNRWLDCYGRDATEGWLAFNNEPPLLTLAVNPALADRTTVQARLEAEGVETKATEYSPFGLVVTRGRALDTEAFRDGLCLVQDEASQLVPLMVEAHDGLRVLDACAAPGGKTIALAAQVRPHGAVVASDVRARRVRLLARTLVRARTPRTWAIHAPADGPWPFRDAVFDRVLVDAPCSGLGTVRRDPDIRWRRDPSDLDRFAETQLDLLTRLAPLVARGGRLIYSTCSSEPEENEEVVTKFLVEHPAFVVRSLERLEGVPPAVKAMATPEGYLRTLPHRDGLEAFFGAVMERP